MKSVIMKKQKIKGKKVTVISMKKIKYYSFRVIGMLILCVLIWGAKGYFKQQYNEKRIMDQLQNIKEGIYVIDYRNTIKNSFPLLSTVEAPEKNGFLSSVIDGIMPVITLAKNNSSNLVNLQEDKTSVDSNSIDSNNVDANEENIKKITEPIIEDEHKVGQESTEIQEPIEKQDIYSAFHNIKIRNVSGLNISTEEFFNKPLKMNLSKEGYHVLIVHSHTGEAFLEDLSEKSYLESRNKNYRDWEKNNIIEAGKSLKEQLEKRYDLNVLHLTNINDKPYTSSYLNSKKLVTKTLKEHPEIQVVIDLHRDAAVDKKNNRGEFLPWTEQLKNRRAIKTIDDQQVAKFFCVVGTNKKLEHPNWKANLNFALKIHQKGEQLYPGLMSMLQIHEWAYNQFLSPNYVIMEIGFDLNTIQDVKNATYYAAQILGEVIKEAKQ